MTSNISHLSLVRIGFATLLLLGLILVPFFLFGAAFETQSAALAGGGRNALAVTGAILLALDIVLPVPSSLLATAIGAGLGPWLGTLVNAGGLTLGCALGLALGRAGSPLAERILGHRLYRPFAAGVERYGIAAVLLCRAVPVLGEASIIAVGAGRAPPGPVLLAAAAANLCLGAVYATAGAAAGAGTAPPALAVGLAVGLPAAAGLAAWLWLRPKAKGSHPGESRGP